MRGSSPESTAIIGRLWPWWAASFWLEDRMTRARSPPPSKRRRRTIKILLAFLRGRAKGRVMKQRFSKLLASLGSVFALVQPTMAETLEVGKALPRVESTTHQGKAIRIHEVAAEGLAFFFFYPKASTGG